jgi:Chalcone isomerase-like
MKKILPLVFVFLLSSQFSVVFGQTEFEIEGVNVPRTIDFKDNKLSLNGYGVRSKMWIEVYVQALYLTILSQDPKEILKSDTEMAVRIQIISSMVTSKKLSKSLNKGMRKSVGDEKMKQFEKQIDQLETLLNSEETKDNDAFNLIYNPSDKSIWVFKNDKFEGKIPGFEFKEAFFGIWLSDNPVDDKLKENLLGKYK